MKAFFLFACLLTWAGAQTHETVSFRYEGTASGNDAIFLSGDLPILGDNDLSRSIQLTETSEDVWEVEVSLPVNRDYTYQFYARSQFHFNISNPTHGTALDSPISASTSTVALSPATKALHYRSGLANPVLHWRQDDGAFKSLTLSANGNWSSVASVGEANRPIEFYFTNGDDTAREPLGTDTYTSTSEIIYVQSGELFLYEPNITVSSPRRDDDLNNLPTVTSAILAEVRPYRVLLPRGYDEHSDRYYPVVYVPDGQGLFEDDTSVFGSSARPIEALDPDATVIKNLIASGQMHEVIVIGIDALSLAGRREYIPFGDPWFGHAGTAEDFADFLRLELIPEIQANYRVLRGPENTAIVGYDENANLALYAGWDHPNYFGKVGAIKPDLQPSLKSALAFEANPDLRLYVANFRRNYSAVSDLRSHLLSKPVNSYALGDQLGYHFDSAASDNSEGYRASLPQVLSFLFPPSEVIASGSSNAANSFWLTHYGLTNSDWDLDNDGDGFTTRIEYQVGTDPTDASQFPDFSGETTANHEARFDWQSYPGIAYQFESSTNLTDWSPHGDAFWGTGEFFEAYVPFSLTDDRQFVRVLTHPPMDTDRDGLSDVEEANLLGTDIFSDDTDRDGFKDGEEVLFNHTDPLVPNITGGSIAGETFNDDNGDGILAGEAAAPGTVVFLDLDYDGKRSDQEPTAEAQSDGTYQITNVPPGTYHVVQEVPLGWIQTAPGGAPETPDGLPDAIESFVHSGEGAFPYPYGFYATATWEPVFVILSRALEPVDPTLLLKPIGERANTPPIGTYASNELLALSKDSTVTVRFDDEKIIDGPGIDFNVVTTGTQANDESFEISVGATPTDLIFLTRATEGGNIGIDLGRFDIDFPIRYIHLKSLTNGGSVPGLDLVGFEAIHFVPNDADYHVVTVGQGEDVTGVDFGRLGRDLPPRVYISVDTATINAGDTVGVQVTAVDDFGVSRVSLSANGTNVSLDSEGKADVTATWPGQLQLTAQATDAASQVGESQLQLYVRNADGSLPSDPNIPSLEERSANAPQIQVHSPGAGSIVENDVPVVATITHPSLTSWELHYAPVADIDPYNLAAADADYVLLAQGNSVVVNNLLDTLPAATLSDGVYFLRVTATGGGSTAYSGHAFGIRVSTQDLYPSIAITAPQDNADLTYLTDIIGTITSTQGIHEWFVDYALASEVDLNNLGANTESFTRLAEGTDAPTDPVLATFDATVLQNNNYLIRVTAWNDIGLGWTDGVLVNVCGNAKLGRLRQEFTDLTVNIAGLPIEIKRTYDSFEAATVGDFGHGWSIGYANPKLNETQPDNGAAISARGYIEGTRVYLNSPSGQRIGFTFGFEVAQTSFLGTIFRAKFTPDPGVYETLEVPERDQGFLSQNEFGEAKLFLIGLPWNPDEFILTTKDGTEYGYHENEGLLDVTDSAGNKLLFSDTGIRHSDGLEVTFTRDALNRITAVTSPNGEVWEYAYDASGDLVSVTDPSNVTTTLAYLTDPSHFLNEITDPLGRKGTTYEYDADGRLAAVIDEAGNRSEQTWDLEGFSGTVSDYRGNVTTIRYDARGNILQEEFPNGGVTQREYADAANPDLETKVTDPEGNATTFSYDAQGNQTEIQPPSGRSWESTYNEENQVIVQKYPDLRTEEFTYGSQGKVTELKFSNSEKRTFTHNAAGQVASTIDATGREQTFDFASDGFNQLTQITLLDGTSTDVSYHPNGLLATITDPYGATTTFSYDDAYRLTKRSDAFGNDITLTYLGDDGKTMTNQLGMITDYTFDSKGNLTREALGTAVTLYGYDADGNRTSVTDPTNNVTTTTYNAGDKVLTVTDPRGNTTTHTYDLAGNRTSTIDRNGRKRTFLYDDLNRMTSERWHDSSDDSVIREITFEYSRIQELSEVIDGEFVYGLSYTLSESPGALHVEFPGASNKVVNYLYEDRDRVESISLSAVKYQEYIRDLAGQVGVVQMRSPVSAETGRFDIHKDPASREIELTRYDTSSALAMETDIVGSSTIAVDLDALPLSLTHRDAAGTTYPDRGTLTLTRHAGRGLASADDGNNLATYTYDALGQIASVINSSRVNESYAYDASGNRSAATTSPGNRLEALGDFEYDYDNEGNLTQRRNTASGEVMDLTWDYRNRLTLVEILPSSGAAPSKTVAYQYDHRDLQIGRTEDGGTTVWTLYGLDEMPLFQFIGNATTPSRVFYHVPGQDADRFVGEWKDGEGIRWFHTDHLGSVRSVADATGTQIAILDYDAYGNMVGMTETNPGDAGTIRFAGREFDPATGFYYNRARWYDPHIGRFLSEDPIGFEGGDINLYRYAANEPIGTKDPTGNASAIEYGSIVAGYLTILAGATTIAACVLETLEGAGDGLSGYGISTGPVGNCVKDITEAPLPSWLPLPK